MLNVFLAIAVDNLATAQEMTADQEEAEALAREQKEKSAAKEATMFLPNPIMTQVGQTEGPANKDIKVGAGKPGTTGAAGTKTTGAAGAKTGQQTTNQANKPGNPTTTTPATTSLAVQPTQAISKPGVKAKSNNNSLDVDKMITRKVDLDYIPGLDDDLKVILPGKLINNSFFLIRIIIV